MIDSFKPRGVSSTVTDQSAVTGQDFNLDALGALKALGANSRIARNKIGITGFSKGGTSALMAAHDNLVVAAGGRQWAEQEADGRLAAAAASLDGIGVPADVRAEFVAIAEFITARQW